MDTKTIDRIVPNYNMYLVESLHETIKSPYKIGRIISIGTNIHPYSVGTEIIFNTKAGNTHKIGDGLYLVTDVLAMIKQEEEEMA